jgi:hypothetical protein
MIINVQEEGGKNQLMRRERGKRHPLRQNAKYKVITEIFF